MASKCRTGPMSKPNRTRQMVLAAASLTLAASVAIAVTSSPVTAQTDSGIAPWPTEPYLHPGQCWSETKPDHDTEGFAVGNCTSHVSWYLRDTGIPFHNTDFDGNSLPGLNGQPLPLLPGCGTGDWCRRWSHARNWRVAAEAIGIDVDDVPAVGSVLQNMGKYKNSVGHLAYVRAVFSDGSIAISDMNGLGRCAVREWLIIREGEGPWKHDALFIHFERLLDQAATSVEAVAETQADPSQTREQSANDVGSTDSSERVDLLQAVAPLSPIAALAWLARQIWRWGSN